MNDHELAIQLTVTPKQFDYIINVLAQRPFSEVNGLLQQLVGQANHDRAAAPSAE